MKVQRPESKVHPPSPRLRRDKQPKAVPPPLWWVVLMVAVVVVALMALFWHGRRGAASNAHSTAAKGGSHSHSDVALAGTKAGRRFDFTPGRAQPAKAAEAIVAEKVLKFGRSRRAFAERIAKRRKEPLPPEIDGFFAALEKGDWDEIHSRWKELAKHTHQYEGSKDDRPDLEPYWQSVLDAYGVAEQAHQMPAQRLLDYGNAIVDSLKPGMVYVGGTDPGRWVPELISETSDDPHIMITQNALADDSYMEYIAEQYGGQFNALSEADTSKAFADYTADAQKRYQHDLDFPNEPKQLLPGENVSMVDGKFQVTGQVAVMAINEKILQMLIAGNPELTFGLQESFPLRGTYADAVPMGPLMELNAPGEQASFTADTAEQSVDYWRSATQSLMAYPGEGENADNALKTYSKDINATANLLASHNFTAQAEEAYTLASQVFPASPEPTIGLAQLYAQTGRADQAHALLDQFASKYPNQAKAIQQGGATITWTAK